MYATFVKVNWGLTEYLTEYMIMGLYSPREVATQYLKG